MIDIITFSLFHLDLGLIYSFSIFGGRLKVARSSLERFLSFLSSSSPRDAPSPLPLYQGRTSSLGLSPRPPFPVPLHLSCHFY